MTPQYEAPSKTLPCISIRFAKKDDRYTVTYARFDDGRPAAIWVDDGKYQWHLALQMASMALQHGVPIEVVRGVIIGKISPLALALDLVIAACAGPNGPNGPPAPREPLALDQVGSISE
jgi:hypothetical protein